MNGFYKILIVDDEESIRQFLREMLSEEGYMVTEASCGDEALKSLTVQPYHLILLDLRLPDMHGIDILRGIRETYPRTDVIIMTSHASVETTVEALRLGAQDYLMKPFDDLEFVTQVIRKVFEQRRVIEENERLYQELQDKTAKLECSVKRLTSINEVSRALHSILDIKELVRFFVHLVAIQLGAERASVMLLDRDKGELSIDASVGLDKKLAESVHIAVGEGIAGWVAREGEAILVEDINRDPRFSKSTDRKHYRSDSFISAPLVLSVPIKYKQEVLGVININNKKDGGLFTKDDLEFVTTLANQAAVTIENIRIIEELRETHFEAIMALAEALEAKDVTTGRHSDRLLKYAMLIAQRLGLNEEQMKHLRYAAVLHDIGKIGVPELILQKPGRLSDEEYAEIKKHPLIGAAIVERIRFLSAVAPIIRSHHEWHDGTGYPENLAGDAIPIEARILAIIDSYDAMTSDRPYRKSLGKEKAIEELKDFSGRQFDPCVVEEFISVLYKEGDSPSELKGISENEIVEDVRRQVDLMREMFTRVNRK